MTIRHDQIAMETPFLDRTGALRSKKIYKKSTIQKKEIEKKLLNFYKSKNLNYILDLLPDDSDFLEEIKTNLKQESELIFSEVKTFQSLLGFSIKDLEFNQESFYRNLRKSIFFEKEEKKVKNPQRIGSSFSCLLNMLNLSSSKIREILKLISNRSLNDLNFIVHNLAFKYRIYISDPLFWEEMLLKILAQKEQEEFNPLLFDSDITFYQFLILEVLNSSEFYKIYDKKQNIFIDEVLKFKNFKDIFSSTLSSNKKKFFLASRPISLIEKKAKSISKEILLAQEYEILKGFAPVTTPLTLYNILSQVYSFDSFSIFMNEIIDVQVHKKNPSFLYFIAQLIGSNIDNSVYFPYNYILGSPYEIFEYMIAPKIYPIILEKHLPFYKKENFSDSIVSLPSKIPVKMHVDFGNKFIKVEPFTAFTIDESSKICIPKEKIIFFNKNTNNLIAVDFLKDIEWKM